MSRCMNCTLLFGGVNNCSQIIWNNIWAVAVLFPAFLSATFERCLNASLFFLRV